MTFWSSPGSQLKITEKGPPGRSGASGGRGGSFRFVSGSDAFTPIEFN